MRAAILALAAAAVAGTTPAFQFEVFAVSALTASPSPASQWIVQARYSMGTVWTIEAAGPAIRLAVEGAFGEIRRLDELLSTYRRDSELSRVNRGAADGWVPVGDEIFALLGRAFGYSRESDGAFDPTVGALVRVWGFKHLDYRKPGDAEISRAKERVGYGHVALDPARGVHFARPGVEVDLGAIAKGYAVDRALEHLRRGGATSARVDAGGNQGVFGPSPTGRPWRFGVKHPRADGEILGVLPLAAGGISTSGDAERGFWHGGVRYGHILDPLSGWPVSGMLSVTAVAPSAEQADALSTTLYVLGVEKGMRLLAAHPGCHALFVQAGPSADVFKFTASPGFHWVPLAAAN